MFATYGQNLRINFTNYQAFETELGKINFVGLNKLQSQCPSLLVGKKMKACFLNFIIIIIIIIFFFFNFIFCFSLSATN